MAQNEDFVTDRTSGTTGSTYRSDDLGSGTREGSTAIRNDIERTRADMDETFAALDAKLTPSQLALEVWNLAKGGGTASAGKLLQVVREHPMPAAVIGLGLGWLLVDRSRRSSDRDIRFDDRYERYGRSDRAYAAGYADMESYNRGGYPGYESDPSTGRLSQAKDAAKDAASSAKDALFGAKDKVGDAAEWTKEHAHDLTDQAKHQASALRYKAKNQARRAQTGFWETLEENPLMIGAATLALGVIAGLSIPSTRKEDELMGETRDHLVDEVKEAGRETLDKTKHVAETVVDKVKNEAETQGLTASGLVDKVKTVAKEATNAAKEEAKNQNLTPEALGRMGQEAPKPEVYEPELVKR
jgi:hypothetical protein